MENNKIDLYKVLSSSIGVRVSPGNIDNVLKRASQEGAVSFRTTFDIMVSLVKEVSRLQDEVEKLKTAAKK